MSRVDKSDIRGETLLNLIKKTGDITVDAINDTEDKVDTFQASVDALDAKLDVTVAGVETNFTDYVASTATSLNTAYQSAVTTMETTIATRLDSANATVADAVQKADDATDACKTATEECITATKECADATSDCTDATTGCERATAELKASSDTYVKVSGRQTIGGTKTFTDYPYTSNLSSIFANNVIPNDYMIMSLFGNAGNFQFGYPTTLNTSRVYGIGAHGLAYLETQPSGDLVFNKLWYIGESAIVSNDDITSITFSASSPLLMSYHAIYNCNSLTTIDVNCLRQLASNNTLTNNSSLRSFVIRGTYDGVPTMTTYNAFASTPIYPDYDDENPGYIYVPDDMVDDFKEATNWSIYAEHTKPLPEYTE